MGRKSAQKKSGAMLNDVSAGQKRLKKFLSQAEERLSSAIKLSLNKKRMEKSPNSPLNKARTKWLNRQRMLSQDKNAGYFAVGYDDY